MIFRANRALLILLIISLILGNGNAAVNKLDSLTIELGKEKTDTGIIILQNKIVWELKNKDLDSALKLSLVVLDNSIKANFQRGIAKAKMQIAGCYYILGKADTSIEINRSAIKIYSSLLKSESYYERFEGTTGIMKCIANIALNYKYIGDNIKALHYLKVALNITKLVNSNTEIVRNLLNIGDVYFDMGNNKEAINYYYQALDAAEQIKDYYLIANIKGSLSDYYTEQGEFKRALNFKTEALTFYYESQNLNQAGITHGNIGIIYFNTKDMSNAIHHFLKALEISKSLNKQIGVAINTANIGNVYNSELKYDSAITCYLNALQLAREHNYKTLEINVLGNLGQIMLKRKKPLDSKQYLLEALTIAENLKDIHQEKNIYKFISETYEQLDDHHLALYYYKKHMVLQDSISNDASIKKQTQTELNYEFKKREMLTQLKQNKKDALDREEKSKQTTLLYSIIVCLTLLILFSIFLYKRFIITQKQSDIIKRQKIEVDHSFIELSIKNKEVTDSIQYASRIQRSLITNEKYIKRFLNRKEN